MTKQELIQQLHQTFSYSQIGATIHRLYPKLFPRDKYSRQAIHQVCKDYKSPSHKSRITNN
jgi:hypothetical protein